MYAARQSVLFFLTGGSDKSMTISECEVAPTFCTNHMENTRQQEKQVSPSAVKLNCVSAHEDLNTSDNHSNLFSRRSVDETDTRAEG